MENLSEEELYFEREKIFLECTYSEHIQNIYFQIKDYLLGNNLLDKLELFDLENLITQYSSLYDVYYESEENETSEYEEDNY